MGDLPAADDRDDLLWSFLDRLLNDESELASYDLADLEQLDGILSDRPDAISIRNRSGETFLHLAMKEWAFAEEGTLDYQVLHEMVSRILAHGADPNARNAKGMTPLFEAKTIEQVDTLLREGARIDAQDDAGNSSLMHSVYDDERFLHLLRYGANPRQPNLVGNTANDWRSIAGLGVIGPG